ncbi:MAG: alpha/beta hydrolase [Candidatus Heimdallarchaeaceae archaeon]
MKIEHSDINFREETINGVLYLPEDKKPSPLIVHLNGMPGLEPEKEGERFAQDMVDNGFAYYAFDYTGVRNSTGTFEYYYSQENINQVISYLVHHPKIDPTQIALIGESFGGAMAISHTARDPRIKCLAIRSPVYDTDKVVKLKIFDGLSQLWKRSKQMRFPEVHLKNWFKEQSSQYNPSKLISNINCPVRFITGTKDEILDLDQVEQFYRKLSPDIDKEMKIVEKADHNFSDTKHFEIMKTYIVEFFKEIFKVN